MAKIKPYEWYKNLPSCQAILDRPLPPGADIDPPDEYEEESNLSYALAAKLSALQHTGSKLTLLQHLRGVKE